MIAHPKHRVTGKFGVVKMLQHRLSSRDLKWSDRSLDFITVQTRVRMNREVCHRISWLCISRSSVLKGIRVFRRFLDRELRLIDILGHRKQVDSTHQSDILHISASLKSVINIKWSGCSIYSYNSSLSKGISPSPDSSKRRRTIGGGSSGRRSTFAYLARLSRQ